MNRENDVRFELAYGAPVTFTAVLKTSSLPHDPVDVTGYAARMEVLQYDGSTFGIRRLQITNGAGIVVGTTNGQFACTISGAQATALAAYFGDPPPSEPARYRLFVTPPAGSETELVHGPTALLPTGSAVTPVTTSVDEDTFTVDVTALAPAGAAGPAGPAGSSTTDGKVSTSAIGAATIATFTVPRSKSFSARVTISGAVSGDKTYTWVHLVSGTSDGSGNITLDPYGVVQDARTWASFKYTTTTDTVSTVVYSVTATLTGWRQNVQLETTAS